MKSSNSLPNMFYRTLENAGGTTFSMMSCSLIPLVSFLGSSFVTGSGLKNMTGLEEKALSLGKNGKFGHAIEGMEGSAMECF